MIAIDVAAAKRWTRAALLAVVVGGSTLATLAPTVASAATSCAPSLLPFFPPWYRNLVGPPPACNIVDPAAVGGLANFIWTITLNIIGMGLAAVGYIAVGYILYGGFLFMTSQGSPDGAAKARKTIQNSIIGLSVSIASVAVVNLAMSVLAGSANASISGTSLNIPAIAGNQVWINGLNVAYFVAGTMAILVIILAGFSYVVQGDQPAAVTKAKNAILYAVVGLIVILSAFAITQFVIGRIGA